MSETEIQTTYWSMTGMSQSSSTCGVILFPDKGPPLHRGHKNYDPAAVVHYQDLVHTLLPEYCETYSLILILGVKYQVPTPCPGASYVVSTSCSLATFDL